MNNGQNLLSKLKEKQELEKEIESIKQLLVDEFSPYKVGEITDAKGYSHEKKKCEIKNISLYTDCRGNMDFIVIASVLKKDGTKSNFTADWKTWRDPKLIEAIGKLKKSLQP